MLHRNNFRLPRAPQTHRDEDGSPLRLLVTSYGFATAVAVLVAFAGVGFWASLLVFWLGGAAIVFAVGLISIARKPNISRADKTWADADAPSMVF